MKLIATIVTQTASFCQVSFWSTDRKGKTWMEHLFDTRPGIKVLVASYPGFAEEEGTLLHRRRDGSIIAVLDRLPARQVVCRDWKIDPRGGRQV